MTASERLAPLTADILSVSIVSADQILTDLQQ